MRTQVPTAALAVAVSLLLAASTGYADAPGGQAPPPPPPPVGAGPAVRTTAIGDAAGADTPPAPVVPTETVVALAITAPPTDVPGEEGDVRLVGRIDINGFATGALQIFHEGAFGAVCNTNFGQPDADVACRQLGFVGGTALPLAIDGRAPFEEIRPQLQEFLAPFVLENLNCTGSEASLLDCPGVMIPRGYDYSYNTEYTYTYFSRFGPSGQCDPLQGGYAFVACGTVEGEGAPDRGEVRLNLGGTSEDGSAQFGRLEVFNNGGWGSVCEFSRPQNRFRRLANNSPLTAASVNVACQELGFEGGEKTQLAVNQTGSDLRRIPILLAGANCTGGEGGLVECPGNGLDGGTEQCGVNSIVSLICFTNRNPDMEGNLRLMDGETGPAYEYGRLEVFVRGFWSTVCDTESFTPDSAQVACRILGYDGGAALKFPTTSFNPDNQVLVANLPVGLASVDCNGTETSLLQCTSSQEEIPNCGVPDSQFTDATVLACANSAGNCTTAVPAEGALRLRGGFGSPCDPVYTGFVEVFHLEEWGAICTGRFQGNSNPQVADVVCRQLGFPHGTEVDPSTNPPDRDPNERDYSYTAETDEAEEPQERFWLSEASCRGPEAILTECDLGQGFRRRNAGCTRDPSRLTVACRTFAVSEALEDVTTPGAEEGDVRLVEQSTTDNWQIGRLEVFFEGSWSQVCARGFGGADANVACRQLGFGAGSVGPTRINGAQPAPDRLVYPEVALTQLGCTGTETTLLDCPAEMSETFFLGGDGCFDSTSTGLMIACVAEAENGEEGALRLVDGGNGDDPAGGIGVLEIFHAGAWGSVCDGVADGSFGPGQALTETSSIIACRQLGFAFQDGVFRSIESVPPSVTLSPAWLGSLPCPRLEETISDCGRLAFGDTGACGLTQRLICSDGSDSGRLEPRLVGGAADPGGAWEYGRLEVFDGDFFSSVAEASFSQALGRRGVETACRTLGFATGAQLLSSQGSALPGADGTRDTLGVIVCTDDAETLSDCTVTSDYGYGYYNGDTNGDNAVALLCFNPSGCPATNTTPSQGDVRLVNIIGTNFTTQPCDDAHFGAVEFFNEGQWGRLCSGFGDSSPVDAKVICRQLGFPFSSLIDVQEVRSNNGRPLTDYGEYGEPGELVWATDLQCTGKEERLADCFFPEAFGDNTRPPPPPFPGAPPAPPPAPGIPNADCSRRDSSTLAVACRRFEIEESEVIRR